MVRHVFSSRFPAALTILGWPCLLPESSPRILLSSDWSFSALPGSCPKPSSL